MARQKKGESVRLLRVGENLRHALSEILTRGELDDILPAEAAVTVSAVEVSPDLRHADVFVVPMMGVQEKAVLEALNGAAGALRTRLAGKVRMKYMPKLVVRLDTSFKEAERIEALLKSDRVSQDLKDEDDGAASDR